MSDKDSPSGEAGAERLLIADDHPLYREALRLMLRGVSDLEVVGEATDGREALELCRRLRPELVLMDVRMPEMDGLAATRAIKREFPRTIVLVITSAEDPKYLSEAIRAGAAGYVLKEATRQQMVDAVRGVLRGESPLNQELAMRILRRLLDETTQGEEPTRRASGARAIEEHPQPPLLESLTPREVEVLQLLARGLTNQDIARSHLVSVSTVKKHVHSIIAKLGVSDRTQAAIRAIELGLLTGQQEEG